MALKATSASLLRDLADAVDRLGEARVKAVLQEAHLRSNQRSLPLAKAANPKRMTATKGIRPVRAELVNQSLQHLKTASTRDEGLRRIREAEFSRRELEFLARCIDVPVRKDQKVEDLEELIVNVTTGGRLNSQAIRHGV